MKIFMTNGTQPYLQHLKEEHKNETLILMTDLNTTLLLHESSGETFFKEPRSYEVIEGIGSFEKAGFFVMNHIPVTDEGRPLFEHNFKYRKNNVEKEPGFIGLRVCRPLMNNTYCILTFWESEGDYQKWRQSEAFAKSHQQNNKSIAESAGVKPKKIFSAPSYTTKYWLCGDETPAENNLEDDWD